MGNMSTEYKTTKVYFEVTNTCNFRCDFCPMHVSKRKMRHMDFTLFEKGIQDIVTGHVADTVGFHVLGEPLLYPRIFDAISHANRRGLRTEVNTNGSLLTQDRVQRLVEARLDSLCVSLQILDSQEHACRGSSLPFDVYYQRVMDAIRLIKGSHGRTGVVLCAMNTSTKKFFDIDTRMRIKGKQSAFRGNLVRLVLDSYAAIDKSVSRDEVTAAVHRLNLNHPQLVQLDEHVTVYVQPFADWGNAFTARRIYPAKIGFCGYALQNVGVLNNGEVTICCADYDGKTSLGNLRAESLGALLSSERVRAIREGFERMQVVHPYCQRCIGGTNPIKALFKGLGSIYLFKLLEFQPARVKQVALMQA
jgi:MoaA/NifB/PqqE/SkfB family radical SAM enzyme